MHLWGETYDLRLGLDATQALYWPSQQAELVPLVHAGRSTAVVGQAWIALPRVTALEQWRRRTGQPVPERPVAHDAIGMGAVHAVFYDQDRLLVLWRCGLTLPFSAAEPALDPNLRALWRGTEDQLVRRFPAAARLVTPAWEPAYASGEYRAFVAGLGYARLSPHAFGKRLGDD